MALKRTSEVVAISFGLNESAPNTFTQEQIDLTLSPLDLEVFVVVAVDLDPSAPEVIPATRCGSFATLTKSSQTSYKSLSNSNTVATARRDAITDAASGVGSFQHSSLDSPVAMLDYVDIIATNNFFVAIQGDNNSIPMSLNGRLWGYRARADAATYAALTQSEILSA